MSQATIAPIADAKIIQTEALMARFGYTNRQAFYEFARGAGLPFIRLSRKRIIFEESSLNRWLASRVVGQQPVNTSIN